MKPSFLTVCGLAIAVAAANVVAAVQPVKPEDRNAALRYATIAYSTDAALFAKVNAVDMSKVGFDMATAPADFKAACDALKQDTSSCVQELIDASKLRKCDFEIAWEKGIEVLLPHLGKIRADTRLLRLDARRLEMAGDADGAAQRLAAIFRMAGQVTHEPILITSLVSVAISAAAMEEVEQAVAAGKLTKSARETILVAANALDAQDPFMMKGAIRGEQRWTLSWIKSAFHGPDAGKQLMALIKSNEGSAPAEESAASKEIARMNEQELVAAADRAVPYYDRMLEAWDKPDAMDQLKALAKRVDDNEFGPIGKLFVPSATKSRESSLKTENRLKALKKTLAGAG